VRVPSVERHKFSLLTRNVSLSSMTTTTTTTDSRSRSRWKLSTVSVSCAHLIIFFPLFCFFKWSLRSWGGHGRVVQEARAHTHTHTHTHIHARGEYVWAARTWPPDNFAKFYPRWKLHEKQLLCRGNEKQTRDAGVRGRGREEPRMGGCCCTCSRTELACLSESRSCRIGRARPSMRTRACRVYSRRDHSERTQSPTLGRRGRRGRRGCPAAISHCRCSMRARENRSVNCGEWQRDPSAFDAPSNFLATWRDRHSAKG